MPRREVEASGAGERIGMARVGVTPSGAIGVDELQSIAVGAAVYASGGGGSLTAGKALAHDLGAEISDVPIGLVAFGELPAAARVAVPLTFPRPRAAPSIAAATAAFRALAERTGGPFDAVVAPDLSVFGVLVALGVAAECDVPVVDAAGSIRAATRPDLTTWAAADVAPGIVAVADPHDAVVIETESVAGAHDTVQAVVSGGTLRGPFGAAAWAMNAGSLRRSSIPAGLSAVCAAGSIVREPGSADPVEALVAAIDRAVLVGRGRLGQVTVALDEPREHVEIRVDTDRGPLELLALDSHVQVRSPKGVLVGAPDLIAVLTTDATPLSVRELTTPAMADREVAVVVAPSPVVAPARIPVEAYDELHAVFGTSGPVPFGIHELDR